MVTFPAVEHHRPLAGTKLYCWVTEAPRCEQLNLWTTLRSCCPEYRKLTHDLLIASPTLNRCTTAPPKESKVLPYSLPSFGPGADPGVQAVSPQVKRSHPPGGRLPLPPGLRLPSQPKSVTAPWRALAGTKLYCLVTEAHACEQLAQGCYLEADRPRFEPATFRTASECSTVKPHKPLPTCIWRKDQKMSKWMDKGGKREESGYPSPTWSKMEETPHNITEAVADHI